EAPTALTTQAPGEPVPPGSTGRALPHIDVTIRAGDGTPLGNGEVGEICAGPVTHGRWAGVYTPFLGYWGRPGATRSSLADGLLHTGDLGSMDPDGHLFVHDRMSDLIIRGGANVRPAEIERVLANDP